ncbi:neuronal acetylcholine receptor subunit alpha-5-like [Tubulanus polymorphus]|uniref:neuronal acetylcholine receptor subunit alpha-5-like n=1 Tax=Tubulanus polymorphus TaxID=672921 RepID=UPI003DA4B1A8
MAAKRLLLCVSIALLFQIALISAASKTIIASGKPGMNASDFVYLNHEHKLLRYLFRKDQNGSASVYDKSLRPVKHQKDKVNVQIGFEMINMIELDEKNQKMVMSGYWKTGWMDIRLSWTPESFGGLDKIRIDSSKLWKPDIMLYNNAAPQTAPDDERVLALVYSSGYTIWFPPKQLETFCRIDFHHFPYDQQICSLMMGSWTYSSQEMRLSLFDNMEKIGTGFFEDADEWELAANNGTIINRTYDCCPEVYQHAQFDLTFKRKPSYYVHIYISPSAALSVLIPFIFLMPPETGDKTILAVGLMLAYVLMISLLEDFFPSGMSKAPLLALYYAANLVLAAVALLLTHLFTLIWRGRWKSPPPKLMSCIIVGGVGKLVCVKHHGYAEVEEPRANDDDTEMSSPQDANDRSTIYTSQSSNAIRRAMMDWKLIIMVMDRVFFLIFLVIVIFLAITLLAYSDAAPQSINN